MGKQKRCRYCGTPIEFFRSPFSNNPRKFEVTPIDGHAYRAAAAFPVMSGKAYKFVELVGVVQVQRECSDIEAEAEVRDMPWYVPHNCPKNPFNDNAPIERTFH